MYTSVTIYFALFIFLGWAWESLDVFFSNTNFGEHRGIYKEIDNVLFLV